MPLILILTLLPLIIISLPLRFDDSQDFYHELGEDSMKFLFQRIPLNTKNVHILSQLLADDMVNIKDYYDQVCSLMCYTRATVLLSLVDARKDLHLLLLGPACLSPDTIKARKAFPGMWPLTGVSHLINHFNPNNIPTAEINEILRQSLNQPETWQSASWVDGIDWQAMDDLSFWRMTPVGIGHRTAFPSYIIRCLAQTGNHTPQDLEELLMKLFRVALFGEEWRQALKEHFNLSTLLNKFSHLTDQWSIKVLGFLRNMHSSGWKMWRLCEDLLNAGLVSFAVWQDAPIHRVTAINDIFELLTFMPPTIVERQRSTLGRAFKRAFTSFLNAIPDWSCVCPLALHFAIFCSKEYGYFDYASLGKYVNQMLRNPNVLAVLPDELLSYSTSLHIHKHILKIKTNPLKDEFAWRNNNEPPYILPPYIDLLHGEWERDKVNWPGMMAVHEQLKGHVRRVLKDGSLDPKTDHDYNTLTLMQAFDSIKFDIQYRVSNGAISSSCFLQSLLDFRKDKPISWARFKEMAENCFLSEKRQERARYECALKAAYTVFFEMTPQLPAFNAILLQDLILVKQTKDRLASSMAGLTLQ